MANEQLITMHRLGRALGHEWACVLTEAEALALGSVEAINANIRASEAGQTGLGPDPRGCHKFPSRGEYQVYEDGSVYLSITRPLPGRGSTPCCVVSVRPGEYDDIQINDNTYPVYERCRTWHLLFAANVLEIAAPEAAAKCRALAGGMVENSSRADDDHVEFARAQIDWAIDKYRQALERAATNDVVRLELSRYTEPQFPPVLPALSPPDAPWIKAERERV